MSTPSTLDTLSTLGTRASLYGVVITDIKPVDTTRGRRHRVIAHARYRSFDLHTATGSAVNHFFEGSTATGDSTASPPVGQVVDLIRNGSGTIVAVRTEHGVHTADGYLPD